MGRTEVDRTITSEPWSSTLGQRNRTKPNALRSERRSSFQKRFDRAGVVRDVRLRDAPNRISSGDILCHDTASYFGLGWQFMELVSFFLRSQLRLVRRPAITAPTSPSLSLGISSKCWLSISPAPRGLWSMLPSL